LLATLAGTLVIALAPVTDGDALCYHLQVPKVFLTQGAVGFDPDLHETVYPLIIEMLYAVCLAFRGPVACRLLHWVLGLVGALNVAALARPVLPTRAWWAGAIVLTMPAVANGMSAPLNDVALASFGTAALAALARYCEQPSARSAILVGSLSGLALGVKYPALVLVGLIVLTIAIRPILVRDSRIHRALSHAILCGTLALLVGGPWYLRAALYTGNPVYPFFRQTFGGAGLDEVLEQAKRPMTPSPWNLLTALAPLTLQPDRFDSFSHRLGPAFLMVVPLVLLSRPPRRVVGFLALGLAFIMMCMIQRQSMRFLLVGFGPLAVVAAWQLSRWCDRRTLPGRAAAALVLLALGFESIVALVRVRPVRDVVMGRETVEHYLERREPTYRVGRWVDNHLPADAHLVGQDHRGFYFPRPYTMELAHRRRTGLGRRGESADQIVEHLRHQGFTHLLLCPPVPETAVEFDPTLGRRLASWLAVRSPLYSEEISDLDGVRRRYAIYKLDVGSSNLASNEELRR
jgi:hypothetical protein